MMKYTGIYLWYDARLGLCRRFWRDWEVPLGSKMNYTSFVQPGFRCHQLKNRTSTICNIVFITTRANSINDKLCDTFCVICLFFVAEIATNFK